MLVLSRKQNERIVIGDIITITVVAVNGGTVRLGITAPRDIPVYRGEIQAVIDADKSQQPAPAEQSNG